MIKHVSFDVWGTLIKPNPEFARARTKLIAEMFGESFGAVQIMYTGVKRYVDRAAEESGRAWSTHDVYAHLLTQMETKGGWKASTIDSLKTKVDHLFLEHPPIIEGSVKACLQWLKSEHISFSIASNSNFISGLVMHPWLERELGLRMPIGVYSDIVLHAKPSARFFQYAVDRIQACVVENGYHIHRHEILHVGDNQICDVYGPHHFGIHGLLIDTPDTLFKQLEYRITTENVRDMSYDENLTYLAHKFNF